MEYISITAVANHYSVITGVHKLMSQFPCKQNDIYHINYDIYKSASK